MRSVILSDGGATGGLQARRFGREGVYAHGKRLVVIGDGNR